MPWTWPVDMSPYILVLATFLTELVLYTRVSPLLMRQFKAYRTAKPAVQQKLNLYPASILVTLVENILSLYIFFCRSDISPVRYEPKLIVRQLGGIWLGRILAELLLTLQQPVFGADILVHHLVSIVTGSQAVFVGAMPWHMNLSLMMELSNPCHSVRLALLELGQKTSLAYVINGVCFLLVFFLCRIVNTCVYWHHTLPLVVSGRLLQFDWLSIVVALCTHSVFDVLNVFWFGKMVRTVVKLILGGKRKKL